MKNVFMLLALSISLNIFGQSEYYITSSDNTKLFVQEYGTGKPVVLLSGGPGLNPFYLKPVWERLSLSYRCIVLYQRGIGMSTMEKADSASFSMSNYVNDLEALRAKLNEEKLVIFGHSWGGMLALEYASKFPDHVACLVLVGSGGPDSKFLKYYNDNIFMRLHDEDIEEVKYLYSNKLPVIKATWVGAFYNRDLGLASKASIDFSALMDSTGVKVNRYTVRNYFAAQDYRVKGLTNYKGDVQIIQGRQDPIGESTVYQIRELLPQSQIHFIEKCGHLPWLEDTIQATEFYNQLGEAFK